MHSVVRMAAWGQENISWIWYLISELVLGKNQFRKKGMHRTIFILVYSLGFGKLPVTELKVAFKSFMLPPLMDSFMKLLYSSLIYLLI